MRLKLTRTAQPGRGNELPGRRQTDMGLMILTSGFDAVDGSSTGM
jgi:hypothetical protein